MNTDIIAWPTETPVCFMAEKTKKDKKIGKPWLVPKRDYKNERGSTTHWHGALLSRAVRMTKDGYFWIDMVDAEQCQIRITGYLPGEDTLEHLECYTSWGPEKKWGSGWNHQVGMSGTKRNPRPGDEQSVFTYVRLDPDDDGRQRVALRCCHGRFLQLDDGMPVITLQGRLINEPGVALTIDEPVSRRIVEVIRELPAPEAEPVKPAVDYRSTLVNPTSEILTKEFTFTHSKATTGTWNNEVGISLSVGAEIEFGSELVGTKSKFTFEMTVDTRRSWGGSESETQTVEDATTIRVPPHTELDVHIVARRDRQNLPFEYVLHRWDLAGNPLPDVTDRGTYQKVDTLGTTVNIESVEKISTRETKPREKKRPRSKELSRSAP